MKDYEELSYKERAQRILSSLDGTRENRLELIILYLFLENTLGAKAAIVKLKELKATVG